MIALGCFIGWVLYTYLFVYTGPPTQKMLKNTKYTIAKITSDFYYNKGNGDGYDYRFQYEKGFQEGHMNGEFVFGGNTL